jgi:plasmid maintenance system antidote protein VapI
MEHRTAERRVNSVIDFNSKITIKLVIELIVIVAAVITMWFNLRREIREVEHVLSTIERRLQVMEIGDWQAMEDYVFMERYSRANGLNMPAHKGDN